MQTNDFVFPWFCCCIHHSFIFSWMKIKSCIECETNVLFFHHPLNCSMLFWLTKYNQCTRSQWKSVQWNQAPLLMLNETPEQYQEWRLLFSILHNDRGKKSILQERNSTPTTESKLETIQFFFPRLTNK